MNKKLIIMLGVATMMVGGAFAHGWHGHHGWHPRPVYHHHYHGGYWGRGGCHFWPGFVGGVIGGAITSTIIAPRETVVVQPTPTVVTQPVVVQQPVVTQPVVVQQPQQVWIEGRYVDQVQANGSTVRVWQPGHYEVR